MEKLHDNVEIIFFYNYSIGDNNFEICLMVILNLLFLKKYHKTKG